MLKHLYILKEDIFPSTSQLMMSVHPNITSLPNNPITVLLVCKTSGGK